VFSSDRVSRPDVDSLVSARRECAVQDIDHEVGRNVDQRQIRTDKPVLAFPEQETWRRWRPRASDPGTRLCNLLSRDEVRRFHATSALVFGSTAASITQYAREHGIDLIVMGTGGCTRLPETAMGSVVEYVGRTAHCPVVTVRDSGAVKLLHLERAHQVA